MNDLEISQLHDQSPGVCAEISIRYMTEADIPAVVEIDRQSFAMPWPPSSYLYELRQNPGSALWVACKLEADGQEQIVGMIVVWFIVDEAHIATIAIDPAHRNQGIASRLLTQALYESISRGFMTATLEVRANNRVAQNLYHRFGFQIEGIRPGYYRDNQEDALIMTVKDLNHALLDQLLKKDA